MRAVLDDAAALGFSWVQLTGGEPLLHDGLLEIVARARELGLSVEVFTNGLLLDARTLAALEAHRVAFAFSVYASEAAVHDRITGSPGSWERTIAAIRRVREAGLALRAGVIVMDENRHLVEETRAFIESLTGDRTAVGGDVARSVGRGAFDPENVSPACRAERGDRPPSGRQGKACVAADGAIYPCIFSRWLSRGCRPGS